MKYVDPTVPVEIHSLENGSVFRAERIVFDKSLSGMKCVPMWGCLITITQPSGAKVEFRLLGSDPFDVANVLNAGKDQPRVVSIADWLAMNKETRP